MDTIRASLNYAESRIFPARGASGGLALFWQGDVQIEVLDLSMRFIDFMITDKESNTQWRCTGFYGEPKVHRRYLAWNILRNLSGKTDHPWLVIGDMNEILWSNEMESRNRRRECQMEAFREALLDCDLEDIGYEGGKFTWFKGKRASSFIRVRLDRGLASPEWLEIFKDYKLTHVRGKYSDHKPLLLDTLGHLQVTGTVHTKPRFRFEESWSKDPECEDIVKNNWINGASLKQNLDIVSQKLTEWAKTEKRENAIKKKGLKRKIDDLMEGEIIQSKLEELNEAYVELDNMIQLDEIFWKHRSKDKWIELGDKNSAYFMWFCKQRSKTNLIRGLVGDNDQWISRWDELEEHISSYYSSLFCSQTPSSASVITNLISPAITTQDNEMLLHPFSSEEVRIAIFDIERSSSPGPDGMSSGFFQSYWQIVGEDVTKECLEILNNKGSMSEINRTFLTLVPKVTNPRRISQFRPIALCNVVAKAVTKMLANRLKLVINKCIDEAQSAFIPGRSITDNVLIAYETFHTLKTRKMGKTGAFALKLDMSKAYDRVEWSFLAEIMMAMGFDNNWIDLIMECVTSTSYQVTINGVQGRVFNATRGLRQGDPLSPLLFVICSQGLSTLINLAANNDILRGVRSSKEGPRVDHLLYADDSLIFSEARLEFALTIKQILSIYAACSGQLINFDKSSILFSPNTPHQVVTEISQILQVQVTNRPEKYLGIPLIVGRSKMKEFQYILDKARKISNLWSTRNLSKGGKEVLVKAILQALPSYAMTCFLLPTALWDQFHIIANQVMWRHKKNKRTIHWANWDKMCKPKSGGGLNFKDMKIFNMAMIAKQAWRLLTKKDNLLFRVLSAKYFPDGNFLNSRLGSSPSMTWKGIFSTMPLIKQGMFWVIGDGKTVKIGSDPWIAGNPFGLPITPGSNYQHLKLVSDLLKADGKNWNLEVLSQYFLPVDVSKIVRIPLSSFKPPDYLCWKLDPTGKYTVRSAYRLLYSANFEPIVSVEQQDNADIITNGSPQEMMSLQNNPQPTEPYETTDLERQLFKIIWKVKIPKKIQIFLWRLSKGFLPARDILKNRHMIQEAYCLRCGNGAESLAHVFSWCAYAEGIWERVFPECPIIISNLGFNNWLLHLIGCTDIKKVTIAAISLWKMWGYRNKAVHERKTFSFDAQAKDILSYASQLIDATSNSQLVMIRGPCEWIAPVGDDIKINFDAAFVQSTGFAAAGVVVRTSHGEIIAALSSPIHNIADALMAEARAGVLAIRYGLFLNLPKVLIEGDNSKLMKILAAKEPDTSIIGPLVNDVMILARFYDSCKFSHTKREGNFLADKYAKYGLNLQTLQDWTENFPFYE